MFRQIFLVVVLICSVVLILSFGACSEADDDCHCEDDSSPYAAAGSASCYPTEAECEDAEGTSCSICI